MKKSALIAALGLALFTAPDNFAQARKPVPAVPAVPNALKPAEPVEPAKPAENAPATPNPAAAKARAFPFNTTVDELDPVAKSFIHINKDGKKVKHAITDTTIFKNDATGKKFEDIKVGDAMNGSRVKLNDTGTEYEVASVTFIGHKSARPSAKK